MTTTTTMPDPGLTFTSNGRFMLSEASILVGVDNHRFVDIIPIDCFPGDCLTREVITAGHQIDFDDAERRKIHTALIGSETVTVTLPEPRFICHSWLEDLAEPTLKAGHVWLDSAETVVTRNNTDGLIGSQALDNHSKTLSHSIATFSFLSLFSRIAKRVQIRKTSSRFRCKQT